MLHIYRHRHGHRTCINSYSNLASLFLDNNLASTKAIHCRKPPPRSHPRPAVISHSPFYPTTHSSPPSKLVWTRRPRYLEATPTGSAQDLPFSRTQSTSEASPDPQRRRRQRLTILNTVLPPTTPASLVRGRLCVLSSASLAFGTTHFAHVGPARTSVREEGGFCEGETHRSAPRLPVRRRRRGLRLGQRLCLFFEVWCQ